MQTPRCDAGQPHRTSFRPDRYSQLTRALDPPTRASSSCRCRASCSCDERGRPNRSPAAADRRRRSARLEAGVRHVAHSLALHRLAAWSRPCESFNRPARLRVRRRHSGVSGDREWSVARSDVACVHGRVARHRMFWLAYVLHRFAPHRRAILDREAVMAVRRSCYGRRHVADLFGGRGCWVVVSATTG